MPEYHHFYFHNEVHIVIFELLHVFFSSIYIGIFKDNSVFYVSLFPPELLVFPIADLMKSEVYEIAKYFGVNKEIIDAAPTDGLWGDNRTDEDQIGASYDELEWAMKMQDLGKIADDFTGREKEVYKIYIRLNTINQHKMIQRLKVDEKQSIKDNEIHL